MKKMENSMKKRITNKFHVGDFVEYDDKQWFVWEWSIQSDGTIIYDLRSSRNTNNEYETVTVIEEDLNYEKTKRSVVKMKRFFKFKSNLWLKITKLAKAKEGQMLPKWLLSIRFLIFPFESIKFYSRINIDIRDIDTHSYKIQGMKFSFTFFAMLSYHVEKGNYFKVVEKENGFLNLEILRIGG